MSGVDRRKALAGLVAAGMSVGGALLLLGKTPADAKVDSPYVLYGSDGTDAGFIPKGMLHSVLSGSDLHVAKVHSNLYHFPAYIASFTASMSSVYVAGPVSVANSAPVTLLSGSLSQSSGDARFTPPPMAGFQVIPGTITVNAVVDLWWESSPDNSVWSQRSAKYPLDVQVAHVWKNSRMFGVPMRSGDKVFWSAVKVYASFPSIYLRLQGQRQVSGDPAGSTVDFYDLYVDMLTLNQPSG